MERMMVGRDVEKIYKDRERRYEREDIMEVEKLSVKGLVRNESFCMKSGEIIGFEGMVGEGRKEIMEGIVGLRKEKGELRNDGRMVKLKNENERKKEGIVYMREESKGKGMIM